ncbi:unnamed protein product [Heligmosomoides polygyrus]|uniref:BPTI/Kunitz inhibitor domain-containing protein n=1 Tax=Heligmosomoides polygyrus TaxID=6339 RepID=A0A183FRG6_HELPZ|nr:unnamed protein product [Heligmosomoides polygyrus]
MLLVSELQGVDHCREPLNMGRKHCTKRPTIRYHMDSATNVCLAFSYSGCGGNSNNFESYEACMNECRGREFFSVAVEEMVCLK